MKEISKEDQMKVCGGSAHLVSAPRQFPGPILIFPVPGGATRRAIPTLPGPVLIFPVPEGATPRFAASLT